MKNTKKLKFAITYHSNYGEMGVIINGARYIYFLDAGFIPKVERMAKHQPGKALALLKGVSRDYERRK